MMITSVLIVALLCVPVVIAEMEDINPLKLESVQFLDRETYYAFINTSSLRPVFFDSHSASHHSHSVVLEKCDDFAAVLKNFSVEVGRVECKENGIDIPFCDSAEERKYIYVFKESKIFYKLPLKSIVDFDSRLTNMLQLVSVDDVPIIQSKDERREFERNHVGKRNFFFFYCHSNAMGSREHNAFLEIGLEFIQKYDFVVGTTNKTMDGLSDFNVNNTARTKLWFMDCLRHDDSGCVSVRYYNPVTMDRFRSFISQLENPFKFDIPGDGLSPIYNDQHIHIAYLVYDSKTWSEVNEEALRLSKIFYGTIGLVTVFYDKVDVKDLLNLDLANRRLPVFIMKLVGHNHTLMMQVFTSENVDQFITKQLKFVHKEHEKEVGKTQNSSTADNRRSADPVITLDDEVAESSRTLKTPINTSQINVLNDTSFYSMREESTAMLVFFYVKFDPVSMTFLRAYAEASFTHPIKKNHSLAMIECFDWTDICKKENVTSYPTVRIYRPRSFKQYDGPFLGQSVLNYFRLHSLKNPIYLDNSEIADQFIQGLYPAELEDVTDVLVLGAFNSKSEEINIFEDLADSVHGFYLFAAVDDETAETTCMKHSSKVPCVLIANKKDIIHPIHVYNYDLLSSKAHLLTFIKSVRVATFVEMTDLNFPLYYQQNKPLVILFAIPDQHKDTFNTIEKLAGSDTFPKILFTWMDLTLVNSLGTSILQLYANNPFIPAIVYLDLVKAQVFLYKRKTFEVEFLREWILNVENSRISPTHILPKREWKPVNLGYDFSKKLPDEAREDVKMRMNEDVSELDTEGKPLEEPVGEVESTPQLKLSNEFIAPKSVLSGVIGFKDEL